MVGSHPQTGQSKKHWRYDHVRARSIRTGGPRREADAEGGTHHAWDATDDCEADEDGSSAE